MSIFDFFRRKRMPYPPMVTVWMEESGKVQSFYAFKRLTEDGHVVLEPLGVSRYIPGVEATAKKEIRPEPQPEYEGVVENGRRYLRLLPSPTVGRVING
jgi:hypothetical protein